MLKLKNICKTYSTKDGVTHRALNNISLDFESKGLVFVLGKSGSGKSTLLNIIGGLDSFDRGEIYLYKKKFSNFKPFDYDFYRNTFTGFVFQEFNLINELTVEENVALSLDLQSKKDQKRIDKIFEDLEISELKKRKIFELSGGQKQRVAIARALVKDPKIILADEPTGSLDTKTTQDIIDLLVKLSKDRLVIVITHNRELAEKYGDRVIELKDGEVLKDLSVKELNDEEKHASLIASSILKIPPKTKVRKEDINRLNEVLTSEKVDHYLSFETDQNKVKSMFPHLKEAISTDNEEEKEKFKQYVYQEEENQEVKLIKSKLPFKRGLKFGLSNLKIKIPKLIFTILLATIAITISGCVDNFAAYDEDKAITNTIYHEDLNYLKIKSGYSMYTSYDLKEKDIETINEINKKEAPLIYSESIRITNYPKVNLNYVINSSITQFIETNNIEDYGYKYLAKSTYEYQNNGVIISELIARELAYLSNKESKEMLDEPIHFENKEFFIKGIYAIENIDKYDFLRNNDNNIDLKIDYMNLYHDKLSQVFVDKGFIDYYKSLITSEENLNLNVEFDNLDYMFTSSSIYLKNNDYQVVDVSDEDGIYLPQKVLLAQMNDEYDSLEEYITYLNSLNKTISLSDPNKNAVYYITEDLNIKGYVTNITNGVIVEKELFEKVTNFTLRPDGALLSIKGLSKTKINNLVKEIYSKGYVIDEDFVDNYSILLEIFALLESVLSGVNTLVFILAIILLFSFMLSSIRNNKRQIGTLRAIGANIVDIIKIYVIEALIIGLISLAISLLIYGVGGSIINNVILEEYVSVFTFGASTVIKMITSTLIVVGLSLIIPIIKIARMDPVEAIRGE